MIYFICPTSNVFELPRNQKFLATAWKDLLCILLLLAISSQHPTQNGLNNKRNVLAPEIKREREREKELICLYTCYMDFRHVCILLQLLWSLILSAVLNLALACFTQGSTITAAVLGFTSILPCIWEKELHFLTLPLYPTIEPQSWLFLQENIDHMPSPEPNRMFTSFLKSIRACSQSWGWVQINLTL